MSEKKDVPRLSPPLEAVLLDEIVLSLNNLIKTIEATIPQGESPCFLRTVTNEMVNLKHAYSMNWFSASIHNYGPNSVFIGINKHPELSAQYSDEIIKGESRDVDMGAAKIQNIFAQCIPGQTATVRVRGVY